MGLSMVALAKRAIACKGWRWMPGMLVHATVDGDASQYRLDGADELYKESCILVYEQRIYEDTDDVCDIFPDLSDPATLGCLLALVREARKAPGAYAKCDRPEDREPGLPWCVNFGDGSSMVGVFASEAEALVAALECAP